MSGTNPKVDTYFDKLDTWHDELVKLRHIVLDCGLVEELKWGCPCYTFSKHNVVIIGGLKDRCVLSFFKGALLADTDGILEQPGEHTQGGRVIRFTSVREIVDMEAVLKAYIHEAVEVEKAGVKVDFKETAELVLPEEFQWKLDEVPGLKKAFDALTPGRQRAYALYFSAPKQSSTRTSRIEKHVQDILDGRGMNDGYMR